jgi:transcriptional regulator with XRE-family HTH domain
MKLTDQLAQRRDKLNRTNTDLAATTGAAASHLSLVLRGKKDVQASTLDALAGALDAQWVLIPRHLMPEVERLLSGKAIGPDNVPSAMEKFLRVAPPAAK